MMKKLYKKKSSSSVHPSPPVKRDSDQLSLLPAAIFTLTFSLSLEDKQVLAYLVSSTHFPTTNKKNTTSYKTSSSSLATDHPPVFNCSCFRCYMSFWVRWDSSPNSQLIHEIIDAFEEHTLLLNNNNKDKTYTKKERKKKPSFITNTNDSNEEETIIAESTELTRSPEMSLQEFTDSESVVKCEEEGSVRKLVSFLAERIWSVWT